jgi:hypothetical protein
MAFVRFNVDKELRKFVRGRKTKVDPAVLLHLLALDYLDACKPSREPIHNRMGPFVVQKVTPSR